MSWRTNCLQICMHEVSGSNPVQASSNVICHFSKLSFSLKQRNFGEVHREESKESKYFVLEWPTCSDQVESSMRFFNK